MARLWTDIIDPATLTGFVRASLSDYEASRGTLARWLPNRQVPDISVRMIVGQFGLVEEARYRSFDAEPEFGKQPQGKRMTVDLVPLSQQGIVSERDQLRLRQSDIPDVALNILLESAQMAARAISDRSERQRGSVLATGKAVIDQDNYKDEADFGRRGDFTTTAPALWSLSDTDRIGQIESWVDLYREENGEEPGALVMSTRAARALAAGDQFAIQLVNGGNRPATLADARTILAGAGLPEIVLYDRKTSSGKVIADDRVLVLPAPVDVNGDSELGATFWGQTLAATEPEYGIEPAEQPGVVSAAFTHDGIPPILHTYVDSLTLPVLANGNLSMSVKVL